MSGDVLDFVLQASVWVIPVLFAVTFHEAAHGWVAKQLGDDTAARLGRVTFNPIKHIDPFGTIILPGMLILLNSPFVFGYAKPVPVNMARLNNPRRDMVWVALAGPGANILLACVAAVLLHATAIFPPGVAAWWRVTFELGLVLNVVLAVFNMLPLPPLDGGRIVTCLLPRRYEPTIARIERFGIVIVLVLFFVIPLAAQEFGVSISPLSAIILPPTEAVASLIANVFGVEFLALR